MFFYNNKSELFRKSGGAGNFNAEELCTRRMEIPAEVMCEGFPIEFVMYFKYVTTLGFDEDPDYKFIKKLFMGVITKMREAGNQMVVEWMNVELVG